MTRRAIGPDRPAPGARIRRSADASGWRASCLACGWTTARRTRQARDRDVDAHELAHEAVR
jgi:hypothetical protein